jgi:heme exporter protein A
MMSQIAPRAASAADQNSPALSLSARDLSCARGGRVLFSGLSILAKPGDAIEVRGPNGAGKTTLLRALAGLVRPAAGEAVLMRDGLALEPEARRVALHFVGPEPAARPEETPRQSLTHWAKLWGGGADNAEVALGQMELTRVADRAVRRLSSGEKRRLALGRLLLHDRPLWLLDEPNTGLDAAGRTLCHQLIARRRARGGIVIVATHDAANLDGATMIRLGVAI